MKAPRKPRPAPKQAPRATEEHSHGSPPFAPDSSHKFKNILDFAPFGLRFSRENTKLPQRNLNFCPFSAYFAHLLPLLLGPQVVRLPSSAQVLPECPHSPGMQGTRGKEPEQQGNEKGREAEREAHKPTKKDTPPIGRAQTTPPPHHKFAPKNQQKVTWGALKKFSEKFFVGMFRGKEKPLALSQRKGAR